MRVCVRLASPLTRVRLGRAGVARVGVGEVLVALPGRDQPGKLSVEFVGQYRPDPAQHPLKRKKK